MSAPELVADDTCKSCGGGIAWCVTTKGGTMPLDPQPVPDGNLIIDGKGYTSKMVLLPRVLVLGKVDQPSGEPLRYVSHFVSCPDAKGWRKS